jgi:hypothetical protein
MRKGPVLEVPTLTSGSVSNSVTSEIVMQFELTFQNIGVLVGDLRQDVFIKNPRTVSSKALADFKPRLHEVMPQLKNLKDEYLERLISEADTDDIDY